MRKSASRILLNVATLVVAVTSLQSAAFAQEVMFWDDFGDTTLGPEWVIDPGRGSYSLTSNPGFLTYNLDRSFMNYSDKPDDGWWPPSLGIELPFEGTEWQVELHVFYELRYWWNFGSGSTGGQYGRVNIRFADGSKLRVWRGCDAWYDVGNPGRHYAHYPSPGEPMPATFLPFAPGDVVVDGRWIRHDYWYQFERSADTITVRYSFDGLTYDERLTTTLTGDAAASNTQTLVFDATCYSSVGSTAQWDYVSITDTGNQPPVALCQDVTVSADANCEGAVAAGDVDNDSSDPDPGDTITLSLSPADPYSLGDTTVTLTVTDTSGATDTCTATVTVVDDTPPDISCPANAVLECPADTSVAANGSASASDNCDGAPSIGSTDSSVTGCGNTETLTRTWTADDFAGNTASCDQTITVVDTTPPVLSVDTTPITVTDVDCSGDEAVTLPTATATDDCGTVTISDDAPATFPAGQTTTVTFTAEDDCGNTSSASVEVTVLYGADIWVSANQHTVGGGSNPGCTKEPFVGIEVCAYDKADGSCARQQDEQGDGISHQEYEAIALNCPPVACCTTDANGECILNLPPGDYIVISNDATKTVLPDPLGVSASDLVCGEHKQKHLQQIVKANGNKVPGKTRRLTGSEMLIIEPEYVIWDSTEQLYPFVFETVGEWGVTATVAPPEGFVADHESLSAEVDNEIEAVQFTITEVGSDLVPTETAFEVIHNGQRRTVHSRVGIRLTAAYAESRGFNVAVLRAQGLIKERPENRGRNEEHGGR